MRMKLLAAAGLLCCCALLWGCGEGTESYVNEEIAKKTNAEQTACNGTAHSIYTAAQSAISDMLSGDQWTLSDVNGVYNMSGSEFALAISGSLNPKDALKYRMSVYFEELKKIDSVTFRIENGTCLYVAVKDERGMYGTYPNALNAADTAFIDSLSEAAFYAENGMSDALK